MKSVICSSSAAPARARLGERGAGAPVRLAGQPARSVEPELGHVGALAQPLVAALLLAQRRPADPVTSRMSSTIWKSTPSSPAKARKAGLWSGPSPPQSSSTHSMLAAISRPVLSSCSRRRPSAPAGAVSATSMYWPADHARRRRSRRPAQRRPRARRRGSPPARLSSSRNASAYSPSPARIATSSPKALWQVGRPAAQVVVVHRRQVVVDQRVGVDQLDRRGQRQHAGAVGARSPRRSPARAPAGSACRRPAASSASPPRGPRWPARRRSAASPGSARPRSAGGRGRRGRVRSPPGRCGGARGRHAGLRPPGSGSWPGRSGSGSSAARVRSSTCVLASVASRAHSSIRASVGVGLELAGAQPARGLLEPGASSIRGSITATRLLTAGQPACRGIQRRPSSASLTSASAWAFSARGTLRIAQRSNCPQRGDRLLVQRPHRRVLDLVGAGQLLGHEL